MGILLIPGEAPRHIAPAIPPAFSLSELQFFVGGYIQLVMLSWNVLEGMDGTKDGGHLIMVMNEDGKSQQLPLNKFATSMARDSITPGDVIVGPVVICTQTEAGYE